MAYDRTIPGAVSPERAERLSAWAQRKPRVALMGEFSAGKSTLLNFLIEENVIPTRATATEVPPVWFSHGEGGTFWVDAEGDSHPIRNDQIGEVPMSARYVRVFSKAEILEHCDIVDTPGISDPNLAVESWRFAAGVANLVLWCSSATQAWRETERSAWLSLPERLRKHSLLIVTRADKLVAEGDRDKVQRRLARETAELFRDRVFMATPDAVKAKAELAGGETSPLWETSGAAALLDHLAERFEAIYSERAARLRQRLTGEAEPVAPAAVEAEPEAEAPTVADEAFIGPRPARPARVVAGGPRRSERLRPEDAEAMLANIRGETPPEDAPAAAAVSAVEEDDVFGADDDKDDRAFRDALGLDEPVVTTLASDEAEATAQAEPETTGFAVDEVPEEAGEPEAADAMWDAAAAEEPSAGSDTEEPLERTPEALAEAEPGASRWQTSEAPGEDAGKPGFDRVAEETEAEAEVPEAEAEAMEAEAEAPAEAVADAEPEQDERALLEEVAEPELAVASEEEVAPEEAAEAAEPEDVAAADAPGAPAVVASAPYLLAAEHFVAAGRTQAAAVPPAVQLWRGIVARTELLPGNAQIAAMIEELLMALESDTALPDSETGHVAAAVESEAEAEDDAAEVTEAAEAAMPEVTEELAEEAEAGEVAASEVAEDAAEVTEAEDAAEPDETFNSELAKDAAEKADVEEAAESDEACESDSAEDIAETVEPEVADDDAEVVQALETAESDAQEVESSDAEAPSDESGDAGESDPETDGLPGWRRLA
jgi:hypothetical protein